MYKRYLNKMKFWMVVFLVALSGIDSPGYWKLIPIGMGVLAFCMTELNASRLDSIRHSKKLRLMYGEEVKHIEQARRNTTAA